MTVLLTKLRPDRVKVLVPSQCKPPPFSAATWLVKTLLLTEPLARFACNHGADDVKGAQTQAVMHQLILLDWALQLTSRLTAFKSLQHISGSPAHKEDSCTGGRPVAAQCELGGISGAARHKQASTIASLGLCGVARVPAAYTQLQSGTSGSSAQSTCRCTT